MLAYRRPNHSVSSSRREQEQSKAGPRDRKGKLREGQPVEKTMGLGVKRKRIRSNHKKNRTKGKSWEAPGHTKHLHPLM